jgi:hypothetical protein
LVGTHKGNANNANSAVNANNSGISKAIRRYEVEILVQITAKIKKGTMVAAGDNAT